VAGANAPAFVKFGWALVQFQVRQRFWLLFLQHTSAQSCTVSRRP